MSKAERPPITPEYLEEQGPPMVSSPAPGIVMIISGDGYETVDMTPEHAVRAAEQLLFYAQNVKGGGSQ